MTDKKLLQYVKERLETISGDIGCDEYESQSDIQTSLNELIQEIERR